MRKITKIPENKVDTFEKSKLRVAAYCRVSTTSGEQIISLETQKSHYETYIKANPNWEFAGIYYDEGISGTKKEKRTELLRLIKDCEQKKIDFIVTKSISRFSRNTTDCLELVRKLVDIGVYIYFEKENLNTESMESELMLSILSGIAESESVCIAENNKWSVQRRFQNGTYKMSSTPYGYDYIDGEMVVSKEQAKVVKFIFAEALAGRGTGKIADELNEKGIKPKKGNKWASATIRGMLSNEKYVGDVILQKTYTDDNFNRHTNYGEKDQYYIQNHHEAIISREDFQTVDEIINQRGKEKGIVKGIGKYQNRYPFSGKLKCSECGSIFKRRSHTNGNNKYVAWCCQKHLSNVKECSMLFIREEDVEIAFTTMMNKLIFSHEVVLKPLLRSLQGLNDKDRLLQIQEYETKLEKNMEQRQVLTSLMASGILEPALFNSENNTLIQEKEMLDTEKNKLIHSVSGDRTKFDALEKLIKYVSGSEMLKEYEDEVFIAHVDKITVVSREEIIFLLKCGLELRERMG